MVQRAPSDPFRVFMSGAVVVRGPVQSLQDFLATVQSLAENLRLEVVYVKSSGSKLWIKEGDGP